MKGRDTMLRTKLVSVTIATFLMTLIWTLPIVYAGHCRGNHAGQSNCPPAPADVHDELKAEHADLSTEHDELGLASEHTGLATDHADLATDHAELGLASEHTGLATDNDGLATDHADLSTEHAGLTL